MTITIIGAGYVGLTTSALLAVAGHKVYCLDIDEEKIKIIKSGKSHFYEPGLDSFVKKVIDSGNLIPTLSYADSIPESEIVIISVGTPQNDKGEFNLTYVFDSASKVIEQVSGSKLVLVQKSTVPVGTGKKITSMAKSAGKDIDVLSCPEFLAESTAVLDTLNMDRFVIGGESNDAKSKVIELFEGLDDFSKTVDYTKLAEFQSIYNTEFKTYNKIPFKDRVISVGIESAELIKVTANAYLSTKISFANSIARIAEGVGADITEVMDGIGADRRIGRSFLYAGLGWGGGCFPKDTAGLVAIADDIGFDFELLKAVRNINFSQVDYVVDRVKSILGGLENKSIAILGLSFKPGTSDVRESPAIKLAKAFTNAGSQVSTYDPEATNEAKKILKDDVIYASSVEEIATNSDFMILATEWPEFVSADYEMLGKLMKQKNIFDARNALNRIELEDIGFKYYGIGR